MDKVYKLPKIAFPEVTGDTVSFYSEYAGLPLKKCIVDVNAWQEGSGDPSPSNVRAIHGFSEVNATRAGKNIKPNEGNNDTYQGVEVTYSPIDDTYTLNGTAISETTVALKVFSKLYWKIDTYYTISVTVISGNFVIPSGTGNTYAVTIGNNRFTRIIRGATSNTANKLNGYKGSGLSFNSNAYRLVFQVFRAGMVFNNLKIKIQIEAGSTATAYEPYVTPTIYTIQLGQEVYGAEVDVVNGVAHVTDYIPDFTNARFFRGNRGGGATGYYFSTSDSYSKQLPLCSLGPGDLTLAKSKEKFNYGTIENAYNHIGNFAWAYRPDNTQTVIRISLDGIETLDDFNAIKSNLQVKYPLETPFDIQLTPAQIETIQGNNTIFADTGDSTVQYIRVY